MFEQSPFSGDCAYATAEVIVMILGSMALGVLLGFLIWGWTRRKLLAAEKRLKALEEENVSLLKSRLLVESTENSTVGSRAAFITLNARHKTRILELERDIESLRKKLEDIPRHVSEERAQSDMYVTDPFDQVQEHTDSTFIQNEMSPEELEIASSVMGRPVSPNDLTLIEGIGPAIAELLNKSGITTWSKLASTTKQILRVILDEGGPQFRIHKPKTWPRQAAMAENGEWKKLREYQEVLKGGV